jgi:hypothetical protein
MRFIRTCIICGGIPILAALPLLVLAGCGKNAPGPPPPPTPASSDVADCFEGNCTLLLTKPATVPLDAKKLYYPSMRVTAISAESLT